MYYGGDYNPEQWPEEVWLDDVVRMREAGVNLVSLGIFSWSRIQPAEGRFEFEWLDRVIELLHENGIAVDLATATASPPPWMHEKYPQILPVTRDGVTLGPGSRQHFAPSSPEYRRLAAELVTAIAARYANHPAVVMWHVNNEYGCHVHHDYSDAAATAFRGWLERRYGTIDSLNTAWGTDFWSQRYTEFSQVLPPRVAPSNLNPTQLLDFRRFSSDALLECYLMERDIIRASGATQTITTNFMGSFPPLDYWEWAKHVDIVSDDAYPDPHDPQSFRLAAFQRDLMRSLKPNTPWLLMEQGSSALNWRPSNAPKAPGQMAALSWQAVGRGADGVMFFQWRQSKAGAEKFHSGMLPHAGTRTRTWREIVALGEQLAALPALENPTPARVAIVLDWQNAWATQSPDHPVVLDYFALVQDWHAALQQLHVAVDFVRPDDDLTGRDLVIAPQLYLLAESGAANLRGYVDGGGTLLVGAFSDVVDVNDHFRPGGYLTQLCEALGVWVEDFGALQIERDAPGLSSVTFDLDGAEVVGRLLAEEIHLTTAEGIATYSDGRLPGHPVLTRNRSGAGTAWYLATIPDRAGLVTVARRILTEASIEIEELPAEIEISRRGDLLLAINHSGAPVTVPLSSVDYIDGSAVHDPELPAHGVLMLRAD